MSNENVNRIGIYSVGSLVEKELGWIFREQPISDYGIDAQIEIRNEDEYPTGKLIALQIKTGKSYFNGSRNTDEICFTENNSEHYKYWTNHVLPVIIVIYNPETKECIWEHVNQNTMENTSTGLKIKISRKKPLNKTASKDLEKIADNITITQRKLNLLTLAKPLMKELQDGNTVIIEFDDYINKSWNIRRLELTIEKNDGKDKVEVEWPFQIFPTWDYEKGLRELFPWAEIGVDEEFYEENEDIDEYPDEFYCYDKEDNKYIQIYDSDDPIYEERQNRPKIRPYTNAAGECDYYRLKLELNDIGKSFVVLTNYLDDNQIQSPI